MKVQVLSALALVGAFGSTAASVFVAPAAFAQTSQTQRGLSEARSILRLAALESKGRSYSPASAVNFKASDNVFLKSALAIDFAYRNASVTLPLYRGLSPKGESVYFILTESSDFEVAKAMGLNYSPKLANAVGTEGAQVVTLNSGLIQFKGNIDFSPVREIVRGDASPFPPAVARPGAIADAEYSSAVVLPSGIVVNAQIVHNESGSHDRTKSIDLQNKTITLAMLDGFQGGKQYFYHLVTDVSAAVPATIENGAYAEKLGKLPAFGKSISSDKSALLGFSPLLNGITDTSTGQDQGFNSSIGNGGIDPINVFPLQPNNENSLVTNNYSPMWDAHVSMWSEEAFAQNKVRRVTGFDDLKALIKQGLIYNAYINPPAVGNPWLGGLRPTQVVINCPVIAQPNLDK